MRVQILRTPSLGDNSYLLDHDGIALAVDPQRDVDRFLEAMSELGSELRFVLETHLHNDYISGGRELAHRSGAELVLPAGAGAAYPHTPAFHLEDLDAGTFSVRPLHTPGHTPEHLSYLAILEGRPVALFSGGSLLAGSAGRTDLLGNGRAHQLARLQFGSLRRLAALPAEVALYPTHGPGSFCTTSVAGANSSTIGEELRSNPSLRYEDAEEFAVGQLSGLQPYPAYYAHMAPINLYGPEPFPDRSVRGLAPDDLADLGPGVEIVDGRPRRAFAQAHVPGSWGIEAGEDFASWVGWLLPFNVPIALVLDPGQEPSEIVTDLGRIGFEDVRGVLPGLGDWIAQGRPVESLRLLSSAEFARLDGPDPQVLDVRSPGEWSGGHLPGSIHRYLPDLSSDIPGELDRERPVYVGCSSGHRAIIAAGILQRARYRPVVLSGNLSSLARPSRAAGS